MPRDDVFIQTKLWTTDYGFDEALHGFDRSVGKLGLETLDSYVMALAETHGKAPAQVVLAGHLAHGVQVIPKSVNPQRIHENADIFDIALSADEVAAIDALDRDLRGGPTPEDVTTNFFGLVIED